LFWCICCAVVAHAYGAPCAAILVLLYIWKDLMVCLVLESPRAGCAGSLSDHQRESTFGDQTCPRANSVSQLPPNSKFILNTTVPVIDEPEAGRPNPLCYRNRGQAWQRTHTNPEVGCPNPLCYGNRGQARQRNLRLLPHPSLLRQQRAGLAKDSHTP